MRIFTIILLLTLLGCKEPVTPEQPVPIQNELRDTMSPELTGNNTKAWKIHSILIDSVEAVVPDCEKDDRYTFNMTGEFLFEPVFLLCDTLNDEALEGSWYLTQEKSILILEIDGSKSSFNIVQLSNDTLEIQGIALDSNGNYLGAQYTKMIPVL